MKRKQLRFIGYFLIIGVLAALIIGTAACSNKTNTKTATRTLSSIVVTPASPIAVALGATKNFTATGTYSDSTTADLSSEVTWASDAPETATISSIGVATGIAAGTAHITASLSGITSPIVTLTVVAISP
jgi:hypothetical protein